MESMISKVECPKCGVINQFDNGDDADLTVADIDAVICYQCEHKWLLEGAEDWTCLDDANTVKGKR